MPQRSGGLNTVLVIDGDLSGRAVFSTAQTMTNIETIN
jgi:hypothetical protein